MPKAVVDLLAFNRGLVSPLALARTDVERTKLSASVMTNWLPKTQGAMRLRPGSKWLGSSYNDTGAAWVEFVAATNQTALLELTHERMRVWDTGDDLMARPTHVTALGGSAIPVSDTGVWQNKSSGGATLDFDDTGLVMTGVNIGGIAKAATKIAVNAADINRELGLAINVGVGPVLIRVGKNDTGDDSYIEETELRTGHHSLSVTPDDTGGLHIQFQSEALARRRIASMVLEDTGPINVVTPWGADKVDDVRYDQSADVVFCACHEIKQMRIERRGDGRSWSVVEYTPVDGPYFITPSSKARLSVSQTYGNTTMNASQAFFKEGHVGALFRIFREGQGGVYTFHDDNVFSDVWQVTGIGSTTERRATVVTTGADTGGDDALLVQRSFNGPDEGFRTVSTISTNTSTNVDDADDNITVWYRLAILSGGFTSDNPGRSALKAVVTYTGGGKDGSLKVTGFNSETSVNVEIINRMADTGESSDWAESRWSDAQAFPSSVQFHDGRLGWFGGSQSIFSVSDDFENFNAGTEGDAGPIIRTIATGPVDRINWAASLLRLFIGTDGEEIALRSSSLDEPITPSNITAKAVSTQGSANLRAVVVDDRAVFVQRGLSRVFMLAFDGDVGDYRPEELTLLVPDLLTGIVDIGIQRQPDTVIHFVMDDGRVARVAYQAQEEVLCWYIHMTSAADGFVEKVAVLPGEREDKVYYHVRRTINGTTKRFLERLASEEESNGDTGENWMMDCAIAATRAHGGAISGLDHLEGERVIVWAGKDFSPDDTGGNQMTYTVSGGAVTVTHDTGAPSITAQVGLPYVERVTGKEMDAEYQSTKLAYGAAAGVALTMPMRIDHLGVVLGRTHNKGLFYGRQLDTGSLEPLPRNVEGRILNDTGTDVDEIFSAQEFTPIPFPGSWDTDGRLCLAAKAPRPATLLAAILTMARHDKV